MEVHVDIMTEFVAAHQDIWDLNAPMSAQKDSLEKAVRKYVTADRTSMSAILYVDALSRNVMT